jgi:hypothetical protein
MDFRRKTKKSILDERYKGIEYKIKSGNENNYGKVFTPNPYPLSPDPYF